MNVFKTMAVRDVAEATKASPVIDVGPAFRGEPGAVRLPSGEWLAPVVEGTFLVNLGNIMKRWSNDRFLSTPHGVVNDSGQDRYSIAFFYSPNVDAVIECLPSCTGPDNPPRYPSAVYRDLVLDVYNANYFHRRQYAGAPAAERG